MKSASRDHKTVVKKTHLDYAPNLFHPPTLSTSNNADYARLALQPATRQTVVTTTTTTTIHFAPLLIQKPGEPDLLTDAERARCAPSQKLPASSNLRPKKTKLDPKIFPLARARASSLVGNFDLHLGSAHGHFVDDDGSTLQDLYALPPIASPTPASTASLGQATPQRKPSQSPAQMSPILNVRDRRDDDKRKRPVDWTTRVTEVRDETLTVRPQRKRAKLTDTMMNRLPFTSGASPRRLSMSSFFQSNAQIPSPQASPTPSVPSDYEQDAASPLIRPAPDLSPDDSDADERALVQSPLIPSEHSKLDLGSGLELATLLSLPKLVEHFASLPNNLQSHVLFHLLKRSSMPVLQLVNAIVTPALKRDFIKDLPLELAVLILGFADSKTLCRATRVNKKWHQIVDADGRIWKRRLLSEQLWTGDGSEEQEAVDIEAGISHIRKDDLFLKRWREGLWDPDFDLRVAARPTARKLEVIRTPRPTRDNVFIQTTSQDSLASPKPSSSTAIPRTLRRSQMPNIHQIHPYKLIFRRRFVNRRKWTSGEATRVNFTGNGNSVVTCLQFNSERIISASDDHQINVYSMKVGGTIMQLTGHEGGVWALQYVGDMLVSGSTDRTVRVWDLRTGRCTHIFLGHVSTVRCLQIMEPQNVNPDKEGTPVWEPPYPLIVTGSRDCTLRVWKLPMPDVEPDYLPTVPASPESADASAAAYENPYHLHLMAGHKHAVRALSGQGRTVVSGSYDNTVRVWDILKGECQHVMRGHQEKVYSIVYDAHRQQCASGSMDGTVRLWSTKTGECLNLLDGHASLVGLLGLSPHALVSAAADSTLRIWDPSTGRCKHTLLAHSGAITCFKQDDTKIISGSDGTLKMWDIRNGTFTRDLLVNLNGVWQVGFDDRYCVAAVQRNGSSEYDILDFGETSDEVIISPLQQSLSTIASPRPNTADKSQTRLSRHFDPSRTAGYQLPSLPTSDLFSSSLEQSDPLASLVEKDAATREIAEHLDTIDEVADGDPAGPI